MKNYLPFRGLRIKFKVWDIESECPIDAFPFETSKYLVKIGKLFEMIESTDFNEDTCINKTINLSCNWKEFVTNLESVKVAIVRGNKIHIPFTKAPVPFSAYEIIHRHPDAFIQMKKDIVEIGQAIQNKHELSRPDERALKPICEDIHRIVSLLLEK